MMAIVPNELGHDCIQSVNMGPFNLFIWEPVTNNFHLYYVAIPTPRIIVWKTIAFAVHFYHDFCRGANRPGRLLGMGPHR